MAATPTPPATDTDSFPPITLTAHRTHTTGTHFPLKGITTRCQEDDDEVYVFKDSLNTCTSSSLSRHQVVLPARDEDRACRRVVRGLGAG